MGTLDEIAHGLVTVLTHSPEPEPLGVDLWNHVPAEVSYLAQAVIDECTAAGVHLAVVRIDPTMAGHLSATATARSLLDEGVKIELDAALGQRIEFFRWPPVG